MAEIRQRKVPTVSKQDRTSPNARNKVEDGRIYSAVEISRIIVFVILVSCISSYFVTKEDIFWGHRPSFTTAGFWQDLMKRPILLTDEELLAFDGSDPTKPLYLAVNGSIFDVSNGRGHYGPGGSYSFFAGHDSSRAFVTTCFEDNNPDLRGVEEMYMPKSTPEIDSQFTSGELKSRIEQEKRQAKVQVYNALKHWVDFFENSPKYRRVGTVKRPKDWQPSGPAPELCEQARKMRVTRKPPVRD